MGCRITKEKYKLFLVLLLMLLTNGGLHTKRR